MSTRKRQWWTVILATFADDGDIGTYTMQEYGTPKSAVAKVMAFRDAEYGLDPKGPDYVKPVLVGLIEGEHYNDAYLLSQ